MTEKSNSKKQNAEILGTIKVDLTFFLTFIPFAGFYLTFPFPSSMFILLT